MFGHETLIGDKGNLYTRCMHLMPPKSETHMVRILEGLNLVGVEIDPRITTVYAVTINTQSNRAIYDKMGSTPTSVL